MRLDNSSVSFKLDVITRSSVLNMCSLAHSRRRTVTPFLFRVSSTLVQTLQMGHFNCLSPRTSQSRHLSASLLLNLETSTHSYACRQPTQLRTPAYSLCNTKPTLVQQQSFCFDGSPWFSQRRFEYVQAFCWSLRRLQSF